MACEVEYFQEKVEKIKRKGLMGDKRGEVVGGEEVVGDKLDRRWLGGVGVGGVSGSLALGLRG